MDQVSQVNEMGRHEGGAAQQLIIQLIEDSLDSIHGAMPLSRRPSLQTRRRLWSELTSLLHCLSGINLVLHTSKKLPWAATKMDHHLAMRHADVNEIIRLMTLHAVYLPLAE